MKFLVDENISHRTLKFLKELSYDVKGVPEHLKGSDDETIVNLAIEDDRFVITLDLDFGRIYYFSKREGVGIIVLRIRLPTVERVNPVLENFFRTVNLEEFGKCLIILDEKKFRVRR
jgi:predicted nuclease of predicted toxin-antitoxin system